MWVPRKSWRQPVVATGQTSWSLGESNCDDLQFAQTLQHCQAQSRMRTRYNDRTSISVVKQCLDNLAISVSSGKNYIGRKPTATWRTTHLSTTLCGSTRRCTVPHFPQHRGRSNCTLLYREWRYESYFGLTAKASRLKVFVSLCPALPRASPSLPHLTSRVPTWRQQTGCQALVQP